MLFRSHATISQIWVVTFTDTASHTVKLRGHSPVGNDARLAEAGGTTLALLYAYG